MKKNILTLLICLVSVSTFGANRYWIASSTANWNSTANWSTTSGGAGGASVPGSSDKAIFNGNGLGRCNINANASVLHIDVRNNYTDTIVQQSSNTITVASNGSFSVSGGVFIGGSGSISLNGTFTLDSNALFTSTSSTFLIRDAVTIEDGDDFIHNNGSVTLFSLAAGSVINVDMDTIILYKFRINNASGNKKVTFGSDNEITVENNITLSGNTTTYDIALFGGKIYGKKDVYVNYYKSTDYGQGTTELILDGDSTQVIDGTGNVSGALFKVTINKGTDTLKIIDKINIHNNWTNNGCIMSNASSSYLTFYYPSTIEGNTTFQRLAFQGASSYTTWNITDTLTIKSIFYFTGDGIVYLLGGVINCEDDFNISFNTALNNSGTSSTIIGTTEIHFNGSSDQYWIGKSTGSKTWMPVVIINKSAGTLYLQDHISIGKRLHYIQGTIDYGTSTITLVRNVQITGNDFSLYNVSLLPPTSYDTSVGLNDSTGFTVIGTLSFVSSGYNNVTYFSSGTVQAKGNILVTNERIANAKTYKILINGTGNQTLTGNNNDGTGFLHNIEIDKPSGTLYLKDLFSLTGDWIYKSGTIDATTYTSTIYFDLNNSPKIKGSHSLNKMHLYCSGSTKKFTVANGTTITLEGEFRTLSSGSAVIDSGTIEVKGNFIIADFMNGGTGTIKAIGSNNQTYTGLASITTAKLPNFTMNKSAGTFTVTNNMNVTQALTLTNGIIKTANGSSKVYLFSTSSVSGGSKNSYVDGIVGKYGNAAMTFPVGENGLYRPITFPSHVSASSQFEIEYFSKGQTLGNSFDTSFAEISPNEYWKIDRVAQTNTVKVTMAWSENKFEIPGDSTTLGSLYWNSGTSKWVGITNDLISGNANTGSLRGVTLTTYSYLVLGKRKVKNQYATTHHKLDGGFYIPKNNRLYVEYRGEYNASQLQFNIYKWDNTIVATESTAGTVDKYYVNEGDNRFTFNFSCNGLSLAPGYYILEIINDKNEKEYLRFKMINDTSGC